MENIVMKELAYTITDPDGIHARPAGMLVKKMQEFKSDVNIAKSGKGASAKKLFQVMKLGVKCGDAIVVTAQGEDEDEAVAAARAILEANL